MSKIFPLKKRPQVKLNDPSVIELGSEEAEVVLDALSSKTTRDVFLQIYEDPCPASDIAEETGNSIQNIKYHVDKLKKAGLIEVTGTWYSETGNEMNVYAPRDEAIVLVASTLEVEDTLKKAIKSIGTVAIATVLGVVGVYSLIEVGEEEHMQIATAGGQDAGFSFLSLTPEIALPVVFVLGVLVGLAALMVSRKI
ncbi:transcriptional regulator [Methanonatronarchaeum sp. AMET6-2]|uniref:ArsR/SmtB family transcription factor n=1 Tax=Methanonatronarchaeum sp. AMET6-2 TaxID=2933293 RepID=UPI001223AFF0|nr:transcriptional regulator [Methanonatronarchaeum sp. AMET6-2]RZN61855.1 MAG: transcriptional regulator [Methanonatronarchaeia archaeon]UOY10225.1 helix-turn-helix domain-containing protein [Methanonatronarchaeum sp. AMET6-2]